MKFVRKILKVILFLGIILIGNFYIAQKFNVISWESIPVWNRLFPCSEPITYTLGNIDPRFGLRNEEVLDRLAEAEELWEKNAGKNLFQYDLEGELKIDFVFDERQERTIAQDKLNVSLDKLENSQEKIISDYNALNKVYMERLAAYEKDTARYEKDLEEYNREVAAWNKNPGTKDEYDDLQDEQKKLEDKRKKLEKERLAINELAKRTNSLVLEEKKLVTSYNSSLSSYVNRYGGSKEFDQGLYEYDGKERRITIYQFHEAADLRLVLAHEMGHALGIEHLSNPTSVMYYMMGEQDMDKLELTSEDMQAVKSICNL